MCVWTCRSPFSLIAFLFRCEFHYLSLKSQITEHVLMAPFPFSHSRSRYRHPRRRDEQKKHELEHPYYHCKLLFEKFGKKSSVFLAEISAILVSDDRSLSLIVSIVFFFVHKMDFLLLSERLNLIYMSLVFSLFFFFISFSFPGSFSSFFSFLSRFFFSFFGGLLFHFFLSLLLTFSLSFFLFIVKCRFTSLVLSLFLH